jgi:hypothetical protein
MAYPGDNSRSDAEGECVAALVIQEGIEVWCRFDERADGSDRRDVGVVEGRRRPIRPVSPFCCVGPGYLPGRHAWHAFMRRRHDV